MGFSGAYMLWSLWTLDLHGKSFLLIPQTDNCILPEALLMLEKGHLAGEGSPPFLASLPGARLVNPLVLRQVEAHGI